MESHPDYPETPPGIVFRPVSNDELISYCDDPELRLSRNFVTAAIGRGDLMFGAFDDDLLIAYVWRAIDSAPHNRHLWVRVNRPFGYCYNSFTRPAYRGKRLSPAIHLYSDTQMLKLGYTHRAGFVSLANPASLAMGKYMAVRPIGYAGFVAWFGRIWTFRTKAVRDIGFEFFRPAI